MTIAIVTDSTADLPAGLAEMHGITVVPLIVRFGMEEFEDGATIDTDEFYRRLQSERDLPTTSQPSPGAFSEVYRSLAEKHDGVVSVHLSGKVSQTVNSAVQGASEVARDDFRIEVVDSQQASIALGMIVLELAAAAAAGAGVDEAVALAEELKPRTRFYAMLDTLEYLQKGGRIGRASALLAGLLKITPIITFEDGESDAVERPRTRRRAMARIKALAEAEAPFQRLAVLYSTQPDEAATLAGDIAHLGPEDGVITSQMGSVIGTYAGPRAVGIGFIRAPGD